MWQPGIVATALDSHSPGVHNLSGLAIFATNFAALSPDGHALVASIGLVALLATPSSVSGPTPSATPDATALRQYGWQSAPRLPIRDAGLQKAIALADQSNLVGSGADMLSNLVSVAWRPDGRLVAISADIPNHAVFIFNCATGKQTATLIPSATVANDTITDRSLIEWSSDGRRLAYFDPYSGTLTLWDNSWLPA